MTGIELIAAERQRQIDAEGYDTTHDDAHDKGELHLAATCYLRIIRGVSVTNVFENDWPFDINHLKPFKSHTGLDCAAEVDSMRCRVKAGALVSAEIDRLNRLRSAIAREIDILLPLEVMGSPAPDLPYVAPTTPAIDLKDEQIPF